MRISIPFLLLATHLATGMLLLLLTVSPQVQPNFFRFCALLAAGLLALTLPIRYQPGVFDPMSFVAPAGAVVLLLLYVWMLRTGRAGAARQALMLASLLAVVTTGLDMAALRRLTIFPRPDPLLYLNFFLSSLVLGSSMMAMLIGHWYVMDTHMSIAHLKKLSTLYTWSVAGRLLLALGVLGYYWAPGERPEMVWQLVDPLRQGFFFWFRVAVGLVAPLVLAFLVARTVRMRSTLSATGLLYVAVIFVLFGELLSKYLLTTAYIPV